MAKDENIIAPEFMNLPLEQFLGNQIYTVLQGDVVKYILKCAHINKSGNYWRNMLEGHSFKVDREILKRLHVLFYDVKDKLGFTENVDFYITGDSSVNAFAVAATAEGEPHIINVNSSLVQLMTDDELRFVIGHEIGHLINKNAEMLQLIQFVFPDGATPPILLQYKIRLWSQLSELVADRYGFLAMPDIGTCVSAFFKMSSGLDFDKVDMQLDAFLEENNRRLDYFRNDKGLNLASHPINPIRVQALYLFSQSERFNPKHAKGLTDEELEKQMDELTNVLLKIRSTELDEHLAMFIATAGILAATADDCCSDEEIELIVQNLANFNIFPNAFLEEIARSGKVMDYFNDSVKNILETNPEQREGMLSYIMDVIMADKDMSQDEVNLVFEIGQKVFGYSSTEVAQIFADFIQNKFIPSVKSLA